MNRYARDKRESGPAPVRRIELSGDHGRARLIIAAVLLGVGLLALTYALTQLLSFGDGWQEITVDSSVSSENCGTEFSLQYRGAGSAERRQLTARYTEASERAYKLFHASQGFSGVGNVNTVNTHINETVTVEPELYEAFARMERYGGRLLYLAPVYDRYEGIFRSTTDAEAAQFDPFLDEWTAQYVAELTAFLNDPAQIDLKLLGGGQVRLEVSAAYAEYAAENGIDTFIDFYWLKNAFIADYIGDALRDSGYTRGYLSSIDGYVRNLDDSGETYTMSLLRRSGNYTGIAATAEYTGSAAIAGLHSRPLSDSLGDYYYIYGDGAARTPYIDPADGLCKSAVDDLTLWSHDHGCAELLLRGLPLFLAEHFDAAAAEALEAEGIHVIYDIAG